ncbi:hypothetical protein [Aquimarina hainanensis]
METDCIRQIRFSYFENIPMICDVNVQSKHMRNVGKLEFVDT